MIRGIIDSTRLVTLGSVVFVLVGCTTDISQMTSTYDRGLFSEAAAVGDEIIPVDRDGDSNQVVGFGGAREKDRLWLGLEKAKILKDAGRFTDSVEVFQFVYDEHDWLGELESSYAANPLNPETWDLSQFTEDAAQAFVGADQTTYQIQPYEAVLAASYASMAALLADPSSNAVALAFARVAMRIQGDWAEQSGLSSVTLRDANLDRLSGRWMSTIDQDMGDFSFADILNLDEFGKARTEMAGVVAYAEANRAASPFVPSASLIQWASMMRCDARMEADVACRNLRRFAGLGRLCDELDEIRSLSELRYANKVVVLVGGGRGAERDSFSVRIPVPIPGLGTGYFRGVYPILVFRGDSTRPARITVDGSALSLVDSIDAIVAQDFSRREPTLWWAPTIRGVIRVVASIVAQAVGDDEENSLFDLMIMAANVVVAEAEQADLRAWSALPAMHFAGVIDRPSSGLISIEIESGSGSEQIEIPVPEGLGFVYLRSLEPGMTAVHVTSLLP